MKIYKYTLAMADEQVIDMPFGAEILSAQMQNEQLCMWALVSPNHRDEAVTLCVVGTGNPFPDARQCKFVATVQDKPFVWHIFVKKG